MGTPIAFATGTTDTYTTSLTKRATVTLSPSSLLSAGTNFWNGVDVSSQYLLYSDKFSQGQSTIPLSRPTAWTTPSITDQNLLNLINTLPDRVGLPLFTNVNLALEWLQNSQKYFLINNTYEGIVTNGLVLNYDFGWSNSYPTTGSTVTDLSGQVNTGTLNNGPTFSSDGLGSVLFDGADDFGSTTNTASLRPANELTVSMWLKAQTTSATWKRIWGQNPYTGGYLIFLESDGTQIRALHYVNGTEYRCNTTVTISTTEWKQVVFTFKTGDAIRSYFNGVAGDGTVSLPSGTFTYNTSNPWEWGTVGGGYYNGKIAGVLIYNRVLTGAEIAQNFNTQKSRFGLWGQNLFNGNTQYLDFSKGDSYPGTGTLINDLSGNAKNASFNNGSFTVFNDVKSFNATGDSSWITSDSVVLGNSYTIFCWSNMLAKSQVSTWRTLFRSDNPSTGDHELIVEYGGNVLGYYDNKNQTGFNTYGINVANACLENQWILYTIVGVGGTSQKVYINEGTSNASVNKNATGQWIIAIGNYQGGSQQWGYVSNYVVYNNREMTQAEIASYFNTTKQYYGYAQNNTLTRGLILSLDAGNLISYPVTGTNWFDLTNNSYNGVLTNGPTFSLTGKGSIDFDGTDDYVSINSQTLLAFGNNPFTISLWLYPTRAYTGGFVNQTLLSSYDDYNNFSSYFTFFYMGILNDGGTYNNVITFLDATGNFINNFGISLTNNVYTNIVFTRSGTQLIGYKNGVQNVSVSSSSLNFIGQRNARICGNVTGVTPFKGNLSTLQISDRALTAQEVLLNFNAQKARFGL